MVRRGEALQGVMLLLKNFIMRQHGTDQQFPYLWLAGNEGLETKMETTIMGYIGTSIRIHCSIPN